MRGVRAEVIEFDEVINSKPDCNVQHPQLG